MNPKFTLIIFGVIASVIISQAFPQEGVPSNSDNNQSNEFLEERNEVSIPLVHADGGDATGAIRSKRNPDPQLFFGIGLGGSPYYGGGGYRNGYYGNGGGYYGNGYNNGYYGHRPYYRREHHHHHHGHYYG